METRKEIEETCVKGNVYIQENGCDTAREMTEDEIAVFKAHLLGNCIEFCKVCGSELDEDSTDGYCEKCNEKYTI